MAPLVVVIFTFMHVCHCRIAIVEPSASDVMPEFACPDGKWGPACENDCNCVNAVKCDRQLGCICKRSRNGQIHNDIEIYFVVDQEAQNLYKGWGLGPDDLIEELDYVITEMNKYFATLKLGVTIYKRELTFLEQDFTNSYIPDDVLADFYIWLNSEGKYATLRYDAAVLLTGKDLRRSSGDNGVGGLATMGQVCNEGAAIAEFHGGYGDVSTVAHEIAHLLGADHDPNDSKWIMDPTTGASSSKRWQFSPVSKINIKRRLTYTNCQCSKSPNSTVPHQSLPARLNMPSKICERMNSRMCMGSGNAGGDAICKSVFCATSEGQCDSEFPYDGMICGKQRTCQRGLCVIDNSANTSNLIDGCPYGDLPTIKVRGQLDTCSALKKYGLGLYCPHFQPMCCKTCAGVGQPKHFTYSSAYGGNNWATGGGQGRSGIKGQNNIDSGENGGDVDVDGDCVNLSPDCTQFPKSVVCGKGFKDLCCKTCSGNVEQVDGGDSRKHGGNGNSGEAKSQEASIENESCLDLSSDCTDFSKDIVCGPSFKQYCCKTCKNYKR